MDARVIRMGTRGSALARAQTALVATALIEAHPDLEIQVIEISTSGDRSQASNKPGPDWGSGVFVKELEAALQREEVDLAVHSLKDVPPAVSGDPSAGSAVALTLAAIPVREDPLDVLVTTDGRGLEDLAPGARVGTSSGRRAAFLRGSRPDLNFVPIRGNVETRLRKLAEGQYEAIVLARAGLRRLELDAAYVVLEPELLPPAPGQGALAIQARAGDRSMIELVAPLNDPATAAAVRAERRLMVNLDGGCRLPVGALGTPRPDGGLTLLGGVALEDGTLNLASANGHLAAPEELADLLAERLRTPGAGEQRRVVFA
jgi:hydroxymethylbilane synthase